MFESVPTDRLETVLRYLRWQASEIKAELERRRATEQWLYDDTSGPAPAELHRAGCRDAAPSKTARPIPADRARKIMGSPEVARCECWAQPSSPIADSAM